MSVSLPSLDDLIENLPQPTPGRVINRLKDAHAFAEAQHGERRRLSGELYIEHDRAVAYTVSDIGIDMASTVTAVLHDTLYDVMAGSDKAMREMTDRFGKDVVKLIDGIYRLNPYIAVGSSADDIKLEKVRRAILHAIEDDIRILLIRMSDSLQDLKMARFLPRDQRLAIAREANQIYAPIANRLGIWTLKWRLEDESFRYLEPEVYRDLTGQLATKRREREELVNRRKIELQTKLSKANIKAKVKARSKHVYSIYRKMTRKNVPLSEIYDLQAIRVILPGRNISDCYQALGIVHNMWVPIPEEFDDYIANPKPNGYQSLHTAVYDQTGQVIEVQIRTQAMDDDAERGIAAHWAYKEGGRPNQELTNRVAWLRQLLIDIRDEEPEDAPPEERLINIDDLTNRIYVFTPKRDLVELPKGSTPIDFAYQIHTQVGHRCKGAKVNGKMVSLDYQLKQGDTVDIITSKRGGPSRDWMNETSGYTRSAKTRSKVRQWYRVNDREENIYQGLDLIERELKLLKLSDVITIEMLQDAFKESSDEDFLAKVGFGDITFSQISGAIGLLADRHKPTKEEKEEEEFASSSTPVMRPSRDRQGLRIQGLTGLQYRMANCCLPVPPEPIVGFVTRGHGVSIHRAGCNNFLSSADNAPERVIDVSWGPNDSAGGLEVPLRVTAFDRSGLAEELATLVSGRKITLKRTKSSTDKRGITAVSLLVQAGSNKDLDWFIQKVQSMPSVLDVTRQRWQEG